MDRLALALLANNSTDRSLAIDFSTHSRIVHVRSQMVRAFDANVEAAGVSNTLDIFLSSICSTNSRNRVCDYCQSAVLVDEIEFCEHEWFRNSEQY